MIRHKRVKHGNYVVNEYIVDITEAMRDQALSFSAKIKIGDNQYSRLLPSDLRQQKNDMKSGEIIEIFREEFKREIQRTFTENLDEYNGDITQELMDHVFSSAVKGNIANYQELLPDNRQQQMQIETFIRQLKLEIQRTYVGKLGELAFLALLNDKGIECDVSGMFDIYEGQENTDSFDFMSSDGLSIDVKTGFRENHKRLLVNQQQFVNLPKDIYVGVKLIGQDVPGSDKLIYWDSVQTAVVKGYAEKTYLDRLKYYDYGEGPAKGVFYDNLMDIDRLLSHF